MSGTVFIALLRGINVGGHRKVPMAELRKLLDGLGFQGTATYVQSGNAVFRATDDTAAGAAASIEAAIEASFGFAVKVMVLDTKEWSALAEDNPYPQGAGEPTKLHLFVLEREPADKDVQTLREKAAALPASDDDSYRIRGRALYLHTPEGIGRSKLAELIGRSLGVEMTARNWRTVLELRAMAAALE